MAGIIGGLVVAIIFEGLYATAEILKLLGYALKWAAFVSWCVIVQGNARACSYRSVRKVQALWGAVEPPPAPIVYTLPKGLSIADDIAWRRQALASQKETAE